jgi:glycosyltransferase involved in cell wall biosynthesis
MHIVFLVHYFPVKGKATGGAANYVANIAKVMADKGHFVEVITESEEKETFEWNNIVVHKIRATIGFHDTGKQMSTYKKLLKNVCRSYWYNKEVAKIHKNNKIDIIQSVNSYGLAFLRKKNIPYLIRLSDYPALWSGANRSEFDFNKCVASRRLDEEIQFIALKKADALVVPSALVQKLINDRIGIEPHLVESPVLIAEDENINFKENFESDQYFLTYSELNYRKEIHIIAQIIDKLLEQYPNMKYVVCGRDKLILYENKYILVSELFKLFVTKHANRFIFMGEISNRTRMFSIIKHAKLCILPTRVDNLPNTCLEAMALGKIVVSSTSHYGTSVEQLIIDGYNGLLSQVDDVESLYQKILYAMQLPEADKELIQNRAMERVKALTPQKTYIKMMEIYEETIEHFNQYLWY